MTTPAVTADLATPVYALVQPRHDGTERVVATYREPLHAGLAADLLRQYGAQIRVELVARESEATP